MFPINYRCTFSFGGGLMENTNIITLKHHGKNLKFTNPFYKNQVDDNLNDYIVVDVTSRVTMDKAFMSAHPTYAKDISPFYLGPVELKDGTKANIFEHLWQASKVYPCHIDASTGEPNNDYWAWRKKWFDQPKVINKKESRRPHSLLGYKDNQALYSLYYEDGTYKHLSYVEARKKIYIPEYAKLIVKTESYKWLKGLYDEGKKIALVDFDGYNYYSTKAKEKLYNSYLSKCERNGVAPTKSLIDFLRLNTMRDVINCAYTPAGHGFIIKMLLEGDLEVVDNKVIDHINILGLKGEEQNLSFIKGGNYNELSC